jgi:pimeloyl-ACP methyl ester carboxylesterase
MVRRLLLAALLLPVPALAAHVTLKAADGAAVQAEASGEGKQGVVLVPDDAGAPADWDAVREHLAGKGFPVVAVGLRGSPGARDEATWAKTPADVAAAVAWLRGRGVQTVTVVGAGLGGAVALHAAAVDEHVTSVVLVGPKLGAPGLRITEDLAAYGTRPLLLVASATDAGATQAAKALQGRAAGPTTLRLVDAKGAGPRLLADDPHLQGDLVQFVTAPPGTEPKARSSISQGTLDDLETTGKKYGH